MQRFHRFKKYVKKIVLVIIILIAILFIFSSNIGRFYIKINGEDPRTLEEFTTFIEDFVQVQLPNKEGPFPVAIVMPGCLGTISHNSDWHDLLVERGYAVVIVNSFVARGYITLEEKLINICGGIKINGTDRAGDIHAVLQYVEKQTWADVEDINLLGWSHGGWSIMEAMAFHERGINPYNLNHNEVLNLDRINKIVLIYPYCGIVSQTNGGFVWNGNTDVLMIVGGDDRIVDHRKCLKWYENQNKEKVESVVYETARHTFDVDAPENITPERFSELYFQNATNRVLEFSFRE